MTPPLKSLPALFCLAALGLGRPADAAMPSFAELEKQFRTLPMAARRLTGPLFWLHGDERETKEHLENYLEIVAKGGNGCFTAESRPHRDWLGPGWYRDLGICLEKAKELDLKMWIFDEKWWPSGEVGGNVPQQYASKHMDARATGIEGPKRVRLDVPSERLIAVLAGRDTGRGIDGDSLTDLTDRVRDGVLGWDAPAGKWKVMVFTWHYDKGRRGRLLVDGASQEAVDWYLQTVYQPHYDHFKADFGETIVGYFYDEPETLGDWGTEVIPMLKERGVDWKRALVAWKLQLAGEEHVAARYQYQDAFAEAWGRTLYGGITRWCHAHGVTSIGHFLEHNWEYLHPRLCAGNMFQLQKYSDMGGIDLVVRQFYPGQRKMGLWQMATLGTSISHVYGKADDLTMCEIFGAYGQDITYPQMKWLTDQMQVRGVNFMIPHSFNPRAPYDRDCPPYSYNGSHEPRWPLYRVYADYTSRLSLLLSGGRHVCPVAFLFLGNSRRVGKSVPPEPMTTALEDALFDCDWMPYGVFEDDAALQGKSIALHRERYQVLIVPPVEVLPYATLAKAKAFFAAGGVVVGYGFLPTKSATLGRASRDIAALTEAIWGAPKPGTTACRKSPAGGRSYFLPAKPTPEQIQEALTADAGIHPTLEVLQGKTNRWLHVLHRVKADRDVFLVCNQDHKSQAKSFRLRLTAEGTPECWDPMRNEVAAVLCERKADHVELDLTLEPSESVLLVFQAAERPLPRRLTPEAKPVADPIPIVRQPEQEPAGGPPASEEKPSDASALEGCKWIWYPEGNPAASAPPATRYFRKTISLPPGRKVRSAVFRLTCDNDFVLYVNGTRAGASDRTEENWRQLKTLDVTKHLKAGDNTLAIQAVNASDEANPAGLVGRLVIEFETGKPLKVPTEASWKTIRRAPPGWESPDFDDSKWAAAKEVARFGQTPWGRLGGRRRGMTRSPVTADPFTGRCTLPDGLDLSRVRVYLVMEDLAPEEAARVTVNGADAGGLIGKPLRLEVTAHLRTGANTIRIEPFAPETAHLAVYGR